MKLKMRLYKFMKVYQRRNGINQRSEKQKRIFARSISEAEGLIFHSIEIGNLDRIKQYLMDPPGKLPAIMLENAMSILRDQTLTDLQVVKCEIDLNTIIIKPIFVMNTKEYELISLCYGPKDVQEDVSVLCGIIESFPNKILLPTFKKYSFWVITDPARVISFSREELVPESKEKIETRINEIITNKEYLE